MLGQKRRVGFHCPIMNRLGRILPFGSLATGAVPMSFRAFEGIGDDPQTCTHIISHASY
jgi:hypothetical protein